MERMGAEQRITHLRGALVASLGSTAYCSSLIPGTIGGIMERIEHAEQLRLALFFVVALASLLGGCEQAQSLLDGAGAASETAPPPESADFEVDANGVLYATLLANGRLDSTDRLSRIPLSERAATVVHVPDKTPQLADQYYMADLLDSTSGDNATATLRSAEEVRTRLDAGKQGALGGLHTLQLSEQMLGISTSDSTPSDTDAMGSTTGADAKPPRGSQQADQPEQLDDDHVIELFGDDELSKETSTVENTSVDGHSIEIRRLGSAGKGHSSPSASSRAKRTKDTARIPAGARWRPITLYYADWCGVCMRAKSWLETNQVPFEAVDIDPSRANRREMANFCRSKGAEPTSIPTFRIGDDIMQGWSPSKFIALGTR